MGPHLGDRKYRAAAAAELVAPDDAHAERRGVLGQPALAVVRLDVADDDPLVAERSDRVYRMSSGLLTEALPDRLARGARP